MSAPRRGNGCLTDVPGIRVGHSQRVGRGWRTGTTVISCLLDQDPERRSLLHWECVEPIPPATTDMLRSDTVRNQALKPFAAPAA